MANLYLTNCPKCDMLMRGTAQVCRYCADVDAQARKRAEADKARADLELLLVGKQPVDWSAVSVKHEDTCNCQRCRRDNVINQAAGSYK